MTSISLTTTDDETLEARWDRPEDIRGGVVFCHPDPSQGGTMSAPLMAGVTRGLVAAGFAVLRFNFRGVGRSTGRHDRGRAETADVATAISAAEAALPHLPIGVSGWSFGAAVALAWQAASASTNTYVGIAPPLSARGVPIPPRREDLAPAVRAFVIGDRDQFTSVDALSEYATEIEATVHVVSGSDHFFHFREERVSAALIEAFSGGEIGSE